MAVTNPPTVEFDDLSRLPPIATHFYTTHPFSEIIDFLRIFPHTSCEVHPNENVLCAVTWDENNTWAKFVISLTDGNGGDVGGGPGDVGGGGGGGQSSPGSGGQSSPGSGPQHIRLVRSVRTNVVTDLNTCETEKNGDRAEKPKPKLLEFNHTFGKSDIWITLFHSLRRKFGFQSIGLSNDQYNFRELRFWPLNYDDLPPTGEFFTMILGLCHDVFLESYTLGATYLADYVKKVNRFVLLVSEDKIESAAIQLVKTDHPQCIRCAAEIAQILQLSNLKRSLRNWTPPVHVYFDKLMWNDPIQQVAKVINQIDQKDS